MASRKRPIVPHPEPELDGVTEHGIPFKPVDADEISDFLQYDPDDLPGEEAHDTVREGLAVPQRDPKPERVRPPRAPTYSSPTVTYPKSPHEMLLDSLDAAGASPSPSEAARPAMGSEPLDEVLDFDGDATVKVHRDSGARVPGATGPGVMTPERVPPATAGRVDARQPAQASPPAVPAAPRSPAHVRAPAVPPRASAPPRRPSSTPPPLPTALAPSTLPESYAHSQGYGTAPSGYGLPTPGPPAPAPAAQQSPHQPVYPAPVLPAPHATKPVGKTGWGTRLLLVLAAVGVVGVGAGVAWLLFSRASDAAGDGTASAAVSAAAPAGAALAPASASGSAAPSARAEPIGECRLQGSAKRVVAMAELSVAPELVARDGGWALGYAATRFQAVGGFLDPKTLEFSGKLDEHSTRPVFRVTPTTGDHFAVDVDHVRLRTARSLPTKAAPRIGVTYAGVVLDAPDAAPIWAGGRNAVISEPSFVVRRSGTVLVGLRRGEFNGRVLVGELTADGQRRSALIETDLHAQYLGTPAIASTPARIAVFVDVQAAQGVPRRLRGAVGPSVADLKTSRQIPVESKLILMPSAAGAGERFIVQYIDASVPKGTLNVQILDKELKPVGGIVMLADQRAGLHFGRGALVYRDGQLVSLFPVRKNGRSEIWGASLTCQ